MCHWLCYFVLLCALPSAAFAAEEENPVPDYLLPVVELLSRGDPTLMPVGGNEIEVVSDGHRQWDLMLQDIKNARKSLCFEYFFWTPDEAGEQIRDAVLEKLTEGVHVRILLENIIGGHYLKSFYQKMADAGAEVLYFTKTDGTLHQFLHRPFRRNHRKIFLVDDEIGYTGGMNIGKPYRDKWRDISIRIKGPAVAVLSRFFDEMWVSRGGSPQETKPELSSERTGDKLMQLFTYGAGDPIMEEAFHLILQAARQSIYIQTPYFFPTDRLLQDLGEAAERGVDVRLIVPYELDVFFMKLANESCYEECLEKGVRIYEYLPCFNHSKLLFADGILSFFGSTNWDYYGLSCCYENDVLVFDKALTEQMEKDFFEQLEDSKEITLEGARSAFKKDKHDRKFWRGIRKRIYR